jgi:SAM-dependent methyltransferase
VAAVTQRIAESQPQSPSMQHPDYWWYRARAQMLRTIIEPVIGTPDRVLDVGSADGPSVDWMRELGRRTAVDLDFAALKPGDVQASALALPFATGSFDVVTAFDVVEHCDPERTALTELTRVLRPGGRMFLTVPAYQWAWSDFDRDQGHHRRYTRKRLLAALAQQDLVVERATYLFAGTLPLFAAERISRRWRKLEGDETTKPPTVSTLQERLLMGLCDIDELLLRRRDLPFGSSVMAVATKRAAAPSEERARSAGRESGSQAPSASATGSMR